MAIHRLHIRDFRNLAEQEVSLAPGLNVLEGENAQGKTNFLEAVYYLANGRSFRNCEPENLIRFGQANAYLEAEWEHEGLNSQLRMQLGPEGREAHFQGKAIARLTPVQASLRVLVFTPDSSTLLRSSPAARRRYFDHAIALQRPGYAGQLARYQRVLRQRNQLLENPGTPELAASFDQAWAEAALGVMREREAYLRELEGLWRQRFRDLLGEDVALGLVWQGRLVREGELPTVEGLLAGLAEVRDQERRYGRSLLGPQRDDLAASFGGHPVREIASQGQQRLLIIALKLAEADLFQGRSGRPPVFLLDDLGSELDERHQRLLLESLGELRAQTLLTSAQRGAYAALRAKNFQVSAGHLLP
ncbi:MAG: DNA replication/repair protein RecF [bacterium]